MFMSLASFLFGPNTNCETNSETTAATTATGETSDKTLPACDHLIDVDNLIEITSLTPSVTGASVSGRDIKSAGGKGRRNNARQQNKRKGIKNTSNEKKAYLAPLSCNQAKPLISSDNCKEAEEEEEEFEDSDWFFVEKEEEQEDDSRARSDSEEENFPQLGVVKSNKRSSYLLQQRRPHHINSHSLYSGPRPQEQRNHLQKTRNSNKNRSNCGVSISTLSPSRKVDDGRNGSGQEATANADITRSLYMAPTVAPQNDEKSVVAVNGVEVFQKMDESWFVTPPPCFTSIGPLNIETSPYENLLIEHPSMSVYCSIRKAQETAESFLNLDVVSNVMTEKKKVNKTTPKTARQVVQKRHIDLVNSLHVAQSKEELMARNVQKIQTKNERSDICRSALNRANKVRDVQSRYHTQRRSDRQHSRLFSKANNNRKTNSN